jgi:hypothetical protein
MLSMQTTSQIIDELGGTVKVANALNLTPSTVSSWKTSGRIPKWRMDGILALALAKGVTLPSHTA